MRRWVFGAVKAVLFLMALFALLLAAQWLTLSESGALSAQVALVWAALSLILGGCARRSSVLDAPALAYLALGGVYAAWALWPSWGPAGASLVGLYWAPSAAGWALAGWRPLAALSLRPGFKGRPGR